MMRTVWPIALLALAGCATAPPLERAHDQVELPPSFVSAEGRAAGAQVCTRLGLDELPGLVARLRADNFTLKAAAARLARADALARQAAGARWPQLSASLGATRGSSFAARAGIDIPGLPGVEEQYTGTLAASYEADLWGRVGDTAAATALSAEAERAVFADTGLALSASLAQNLVSQLAQFELRDLLEAQLDTSRKFLELIELRFAQGQAAARDIGRQRQQVESLRAQQAQIAAQLAGVEAELAGLLGAWDATAPLASRTSLPALPPPPATGLPADLAQQRPDVRAAYWRLAAADRQLTAALDNRLPGVRLSASLSSVEDALSLLFDDVLWSLGAELVQPVFSAGRLAAERDVARADSDAALYAYAQTLLGALNEVRATLQRERAQEQLVASIERQIVEAERVLTLSREAYRAGATDFLNVLSSLQSLQGLQQRHVEARLGQFSQRIALCRALGQPVGGAVTNQGPAS